MNFSAIFFVFYHFFSLLLDHYHREFNLSNNLKSPKSQRRFLNIVFKLPMSQPVEG